MTAPENASSNANNMNNNNKMILNSVDTAVSDMIQGVLWRQPAVRQLAAPYSHVLIHRNESGHASNHTTTTTTTKHIALLSGGGSGHEPSHAGWLGTAMLDCVVCGGLFASPSIAAVSAGLQACQQYVLSASSTSNSNTGGILLIVKNYTGDKLNFALAAARMSTAVPTEVVIVADDVALPRHKGVTGARGLAGTVLVHKIAAAAAAADCSSLKSVAQTARTVVAHMGTLGIALQGVRMPGIQNNKDLPPHRQEIGLGIHGEAGVEQCDLQTAAEMAARAVQSIRDYGRVDETDDTTIVPLFQPGDTVVVLMNNLGGTSEFELSVWTDAVVQELVPQVHIARLYVGTYMTSFAMHGVSLTVLQVPPENKQAWLAWLDAPTSAPAWKPAVPVPSTLPAPLTLKTTATTAAATTTHSTAPSWYDPALAVRMVTAAATGLIEAEPQLTAYDVVVGDGDCGLTMKRGAQQLLQELSQLATEHPAQLFRGVAAAVSASMGGTSGVLLELAFCQMARHLELQELQLEQQQQLQPADLWDAFRVAVDGIQTAGGAAVGARTLLDAVVPACGKDTLAAAAAAARRGADGTAQMAVATAGRSNYVAAQTLLGTPDPGAVAMAIVLEALASCVNE